MRSWSGWLPGELRVHMLADAVPLPPWQRDMLLRLVAARRINPNVIAAVVPW